MGLKLGEKDGGSLASVEMEGEYERLVRGFTCIERAFMCVKN